MTLKEKKKFVGYKINNSLAIKMSKKLKTVLL